MLTSTDPTSSGPTWIAGTIDSTRAPRSVSCASTTLCVAVDEGGRVLVSTDPSAGAGAWSSPKSIDPLHGITGVSCPSQTLCVAVDQGGEVLTSADPAASTWTSPIRIDSGNPLQAISCASASLCVAVDQAGNALASGTPAEVGSWRRRAIDPVLALRAISCANTGAGTTCVAVDSSGNALASADPTGSAPTWSSTGIDATAGLTSVSCVASGVCLALDAEGEGFASGEPLSAQPTWSPSSPDRGVALAAVSCPSDQLCEAVDAQGRALTGSISLPATTPPSEALPPLVQPHPSISGVSEVGARLVCDPGVPNNATATFTYAWWRDDSPIPGATSSQYRVAKADATHHLQCLVTASNAAGSVTAHSAFVAVPAEGVLAAVGETAVGIARARGTRVEVPVSCSPHAAGVCVIALKLTAVETLRANRVVAISAHDFASSTSHESSSTPRASAARAHGARYIPRARRVTVTIGAARARLAVGQRRTLAVKLDRLGMRLLVHARRLPAQLTVSGTVIGVLKATLSRQRLMLGRVASRARALPLGGTQGPSARQATVLAPTPYMGWDTYFALGPRYSESTVLAQASALVTDGLLRLGYRYVWLDVGWWQGQRDSRGQIVVNRSQWPHGLAWLTATLHAAGLLAGLYTDAGSEGCGGAHQGSYGHYRQDANAFAAWGFDAVKVDFCGGVRLRLQPSAAYASFHAALQANSAHRPMLLSICDFLEPGQFHGDPPFAQSAFASYTFGPSTGNSWRTDSDVGAPGNVAFHTVLRNLDADAAHPEAAGPGHWNDPDYLGPDQGMTEGQFRAQLSMWAVLAAPLMVSVDLRRVSPASLVALREPQLVGIDQDPAGVQGTLAQSSGEGQVWVKPLSDGERAVALLNRGPAPLMLQTSAAAVGMPAASGYLARDVWAHATHATAGTIAVEVPGESAALLRIAVAASHARRHG